MQDSFYFIIFSFSEEDEQKKKEMEFIEQELAKYGYEVRYEGDGGYKTAYVEVATEKVSHYLSVVRQIFKQLYGKKKVRK